MRFRDIKEHIVNREGIESIDALRQAGYRLVKARDSDRHFLARPDDLQPLLVRLGDIASIKYGVKTGADGWFHVKILEKHGEYAIIESGDGSRHEIESRFLIPIIRSLKDCPFYSTGFSSPERYLVYIDLNLDELKLYKAFSYVEHGQKVSYPSRTGGGIPALRPSCAQRGKEWYRLNLPDIGSIKGFMYKIRRDKHVVPQNSSGAVGDDALYEIHTQDETVIPILNSTVSSLLLEQTGRVPGGGSGPIAIMVAEAKTLLLPNPAAFTASQRDRLLEAFERMAQREVRSIFEELGYPKPNRDYSNIDPAALTLAQVQRASPDRFELDAVVFEVLGLNDAERLAVYRAVVELVRNRLVKARSV